MKKLFALVLIAVMLTGCSLATDATLPDETNQDPLVGVVVTTEYLNLFDMEGYLADNLDQIMDGAEVSSYGYEGRIYAAERVEESVTEDGVTCFTTYYEFPDVDGLVLTFYEARTLLEDGKLHCAFTMADSSPEFRDVECHSSTADNVQELRVEGTIYIPDDTGAYSFYINPVFQDSEGRLYLMSGNGMSGNEAMGGMSHWLNTQRTITAAGVESTEYAEFKVNFKTVAVADEVVLIQMSGDSQVLDRREYAVEALPREVTPVEGCAYLLVEMEKDGEVTRIICQPGEESFDITGRGAGVYCIYRTVGVNWEETTG